MSDEADQERTEQARKLFAGPIEFLKSAPDLEVPARPRCAGDCVRRPVERRQELAPECADEPQWARPNVQHARPDTGAELLRRRRTLADEARRHAGIRVRRSAQGPRQALAVPGERLSARTVRAEAGPGACRFAPRPQGSRPRDDAHARRCCGQLPPRPHQKRQGEAVSAFGALYETTMVEAAKHPAAHPSIFTTSSETGSGIAELRTAILEAATT